MNDLNKKKAINKIIQKNNINPNIIKLFLQNNLQTKKNFDYLKEALTSKQYKSLYKNKRRSNPFETILLFFDNLIKNKSNNSLMKNASFIGYNIPFIYGIERVRMNYYLYLLKDKNIQFNESFANDLLCFQNFFNYLKTLNSEEECDKNEINMIFYQFILEITQVIYKKRINVNKIPSIYNKVNPNFIEYKDYKKNSLIVKEEDSYLKKRDNFNYIVSNGIETKNISEKNYNLELLADELINYTSYPLNLLLYRNESINYYYSQGKNFMEREGDSLFKQFKKYFFKFIKSNVCMEVLSKPEYKNIRKFILNKNIKHILLNKKYLKFIPFLSKLYGGFTNKDILLTVISAYPSIVELLPRVYNTKKYEDIKNFCLLMSIGEKFMLLLHEQTIHFICGYLFQITHDNSLSISPKRELKKNNKGEYNDILRDGGHYFERQLFGEVIIRLKITNVIALFDGETIKKTLKEFKDIFNSEFNKNKLLQMIKKCSGFLKYFLKEFPIDFKYIFEIIFENGEGIHVSTRGEKEPYIKVSSLPYYSSFSNSSKSSDLEENE
jgi:hypothetical protein